jgi:hypothetical protein
MTNPRRRAFVVSLYLLRAMATLQALLAMSQAISIGQYLNGSYAMIRVHAMLAHICLYSAAALGLTAIFYVIVGGRVRVALCVGLFFLEGVQTAMGYSRLLAVHIPLGVAIVGTAVFVGAWSWTRGAARPRPAPATVSAPELVS